jgi:hypothetical protein
MPGIAPDGKRSNAVSSAWFERAPHDVSARPSLDFTKLNQHTRVFASDDVGDGAARGLGRLASGLGSWAHFLQHVVLVNVS